MSIVHGGPGPRCFGPPLYDALTKGATQANVCLEDVYDFDLRNSLQAIKNTTSVQEAHKLISDHNVETILELAGTLQIVSKQEDILNLVDKTAHWFVIERVHAAFERFKEGLAQLGVLRALAENYKKFEEVFCYSEVTLTAELFGCLFSVNYSETGSNNRQLEGLVLSRWDDFLQDVEEKTVELTFSDTVFIHL
ncbi:G2/M phase-specific E3 ubiquitin-protein ligase [Acropora cervicornis]|uniref:G2/M phase-specific E3 ubiquitin-protein ligase n=1 Tax=Acropora cervicornis TaxID=6130 RepID=A0AAD9Q810_ACRCE|nr:G2/M phase-specific E3 ubiquitin-protein ligase [Acropora cervicornis]